MTEANPARSTGDERVMTSAAFVGVSALLFAGSATLTMVWSVSMSGMGMPMPGGWTMSTAWMRMPGETWMRTGASFVGMWIVMMVAMMLPSLVLMLWRYRHAVDKTGGTRLDLLTALVGLGYFFVWTLFGVAVFPLGIILAEVEMQQPLLARAAPIAVGMVVLVAGALQFEDEMKHLGANYIHAGLWRGFAVRDGNLITGQQNFSGTETANLLVETLGA